MKIKQLEWVHYPETVNTFEFWEAKTSLGDFTIHKSRMGFWFTTPRTKGNTDTLEEAMRLAETFLTAVVQELVDDFNPIMETVNKLSLSLQNRDDAIIDERFELAKYSSQIKETLQRYRKDIGLIPATNLLTVSERLDDLREELGTIDD